MDVGTFYRRRFTRVLIPLVAWSLIYWAWIVFVRGEERPPDAFFRSVLLARPYAHLHFLFIVVGLYLITPFLRVFTDHASRRMIAGAAGLVLVTASLYRMLAFADLTEAPTVFTHFVPYTGYFLAGLVLRDVVLDRRGVVVAGLVAAAAVVGQVLATYGLWWIGDVDDATVPEHYFSLLVIVLTLSVFLLFRSLLADAPDREATAARGATAPGRGAALRSRIAAMTLGVYLVHPMILDLIRRGVHLDATFVGALILFPATVAAAFAGSLVIVEVMARIPGVRRLVGVA
jgi:surface polysaccharide O-acyltransferase-like enzyme